MDRPALNQDIEDARRKAAELAAGILEGTTDVLEASIQMHRLQWLAGVEEDDEDFAAFSLVDSEIDALSVGPQRAYWSAEALARKEPDLQRARIWARSTVEEQCRRIVARFAV